MTETTNGLWHQLIVTDPAGLSGVSVASFMELLIRRLGTIAVVALDLVGACPGLIGLEAQVLPREIFLQRVADATQYDWAFFFLYSRPRTNEEIAGRDEKALMLQSDATVRLVDDHYFYIYSQNEGLVSELRRAHPAAEHKTSRFVDLDVPY